MGTKGNYPRNLLLAVLFTALGFCVMGYHPGAEDDGIYLAAVKADLHPALFPHNADFFRLQSIAKREAKAEGGEFHSPFFQVDAVDTS